MVADDAKLAKRPVNYSAGTIILDLTPEEERVALVFNIASQEVKLVPKGKLTRREMSQILEDRGDQFLVFFEQIEGYGSPFGKEELEDNWDRRTTALRETLEETGSDISPHLIDSVSYTERPQMYSPYTNTVYLARGVGFQFQRRTMYDPFVDPKRSGFKKLSGLPIRKYVQDDQTGESRAGIYQATLRRILAMLFQLDRSTLKELGRPGRDSAEDLVWMVVSQIPYGSFFSPRMGKTLIQFHREELLCLKLTRARRILSPRLVGFIGRRLIFSIDDEDLLNQGLEALVSRCDAHLRKNLYRYLGQCLERREKTTERIKEEREREQTTDEHLVVTEDPEDDTVAMQQEMESGEKIPDYVLEWLGSEAFGARIPQPGERG